MPIGSALRCYEVKDYAEMLISYTQICAGVSHICLMADADLRFVPPCRVNALEWRIVMNISAP